MFYRILGGALLLIAVFVGISFYQFRMELFEAYNVPPEHSIGPADADLTVVEFVLYSCETCRKLQEPLKAALARDGKVRYLPRPVAYENEFPGQDAFVRLTYAAAKQGKFQKTFEYLLTHPIAFLDDVQLARVSADLEMDISQLKRDMESPDVVQAVKENERLYELWGFTTVPSFLMGSKAIFRIRSEEEIPTEDEFIEMFEKARRFF